MTSLKRLVLQAIGLVLLVPSVAMAALWLDGFDNDGPSVIFPGGPLVSGTLYQGPEPDWSFTDEISTVELELVGSNRSRTTFVIESGGRIFVTSDYMGTALGRLWKNWAEAAAAGDGLALLRIGDTIYERRLVRITEGPELDGVIAKKREKYRSLINRDMIAAGEIWVFEFAPRS